MEYSTDEGVLQHLLHEPMASDILLKDHQCLLQDYCALCTIPRSIKDRANRVTIPCHLI
jgi:hypothetical protein